jgi:hypothetical protein
MSDVIQNGGLVEIDKDTLEVTNTDVTPTPKKETVGDTILPSYLRLQSNLLRVCLQLEYVFPLKEKS